MALPRLSDVPALSLQQAIEARARARARALLHRTRSHGCVAMSAHRIRVGCRHSSAHTIWLVALLSALYVAWTLLILYVFHGEFKPYISRGDHDQSKSTTLYDTCKA